MDDLEICKRIADIEGVDIFLHPQSTSPLIQQEGADMLQCKTYNPLTDDALCFKLMIKYKIDFTYAMFTDGTLHRYEAVNTITAKGYGFSDNPNKAICLAIIELHKGK